MTVEKRLTNLVTDTLAKVGVKPCDNGVLDAVKEAVADIHLILRDCKCHQNNTEH